MLKKPLNSRHLQIFQTMMLSRNMVDAAETLGISEPAIHKARKLIEAEIGSELFERVGGRFQPTIAAKRLLPYAQKALQQLNTTQEIASRLRSDLSGQIVVAVGGPALVSILPVAIKKFRTFYANVRIDIEIESARGIIEKVSGNMADVGVGLAPTQDIDGRTLDMCNLRDIVRSPITAVVPVKHRLAKTAVIKPRDLVGETLIGLWDISATTDLLNTVFLQEGMQPTIPITAANAIGVCSLVQEGVGIGLVNPLMLARGIYPGIIAKPFRPRVTVRTCLYTSKLTPLSQPAAKLVDILMSTAKSQSLFVKRD